MGDDDLEDRMWIHGEYVTDRDFKAGLWVLLLLAVIAALVATLAEVL